MYRPLLNQGNLISWSFRMYFRWCQSTFSEMCHNFICITIKITMPSVKYRDSYSLKEFMLRSSKILFFLIFKTPPWFFCQLDWEKYWKIIRNIRDLMTPFFKELLKISFVKIFSIMLAELSEIRVGRFMIGMAPFSKIVW